MFEDGGAHERDVAEWERLEQEMVDLYNSQREMEKNLLVEDPFEEDDDNGLEFRIESTG